MIVDWISYPEWRKLVDGGPHKVVKMAIRKKQCEMDSSGNIISFPETEQVSGILA